MRKFAILAVLVAELAFLTSLALDHEVLWRTGETVMLRTVPVDPRDIFRGDYVILRYDVNAVGAGGLRDGLAGEPAKDGEQIYAVLEPVPGSDDLRRLAHVTDVRPDDGTFLAGRVGRPPGWFPRPVGGLAAYYGIEKLFVEQGRGWEIEERRGRRDGMQIPMEVELAVGRHGDAVIRGYRWSPIGITFDVIEAEETPASVTPDLEGELPPPAPTVRVTLHNVSETPRWIVDPGAPHSGAHCSFQLAPSAWGDRPIRTASTACDAVDVGADDLHRLEPGATYSVTLDLDTPRWHVLDEDSLGATRPIALGEWMTAGPGQLRLAYRPDPAWLASVDLEGEDVWMTEMLTPAFTLGGRID